MQNSAAILESAVAWGVATCKFAGQRVSGDSYLVKVFAGGVLAAVLDGVGHGEEAARAVRAAVGILEAHAEEPPVSLIRRCHAGLRQTRGVVMTVACLNPTAETLAWAGIGNVEGVLLRADPLASPASEHVLLRSGLVGYELPDLRATTIRITPGDLLVLTTDGISHGFGRDWARSEPPQWIANQILERSLKRTDDALVLVVRYLGLCHE